MLDIQVSDLNGTTTIKASVEGKVVKKVDIPTAVFDELSQITEPLANKLVQQRVAAAAGWDLNDEGRCPKAAALLERLTAGYKVYNGVIAVMVGTSSGKNRFFHFNESLTAESGAKMLTRQKASATEAPAFAGRDGASSVLGDEYDDAQEIDDGSQENVYEDEVG